MGTAIEHGSKVSEAAIAPYVEDGHLVVLEGLHPKAVRRGNVVSASIEADQLVIELNSVQYNFSQTCEEQWPSSPSSHTETIRIDVSSYSLNASGSGSHDLVSSEQSGWYVFNAGRIS